MSTFRWQIALVILTLSALLLDSLHIFYDFGMSLGMPIPHFVLLVAALVGGIPLSLQILYRLFKGQFGADLLAALAIFTAIYLEEYLAANLIVLMLAGGQVFESYAVRKASSVLLALADRMPATAHRKIKDQIGEIPLQKIKVGDSIVIYPHEVCPVDGDVIEGTSSMDESYLTGEPYGVQKIPGTRVISGSTNGHGMLIIKATSLAQDSRYAHIMKVMEEAEQHHPRMRRLGDQIGAMFTPIALFVALLAWYLTGDSVRFLAVLVIATPCPLLIAIPVTIISAISAASAKGIIIKDPIVLERLPTCKTAIFDKTGTLTYGEPELVEVTILGKYDDHKVLQLAASIERYSKHPLAAAILKAAKKEHIHLLEAKSISEPPGQGLTGNFDHCIVQITDRKNRAKLSAHEVEKLPAIKPGLECLIIIEDEIAALMHFRDALRKDSLQFMDNIKKIHNFKRTLIVSGDRAEEVEHIAKQLRTDEAFAAQTPEQKVEIVRKETKKQPTLYLGDGINDAPALLTATVGIAFGKASNVTAEAGGAVVFDSNLEKVDDLLHLSKAMRRIALQSAIGGMALSFIGMGFAATGFITPVVGALLQEGIDVVAILNALRLTFQVYSGGK